MEPVSMTDAALSHAIGMRNSTPVTKNIHIVVPFMRKTQVQDALQVAVGVDDALLFDT